MSEHLGPIGILVGEGIGSEIIPVAVDVLRTIAALHGVTFELREGGLIGAEAQRRTGSALTPETVVFCRQLFEEGGALLCGPGGGRFVYELRDRFSLYCKLTPIRPLAALADSAIVRPERLTGVDIVVVRENCGGLYFGDWGTGQDANGGVAYQRFQYREAEIERIVQVGVRLAQARRRRLAVVYKPGGVPTISQLWEDTARRICATANVSLRFMEVDNAAYQLIADAGALDIIVAPNMFGDIISDCGALLLGSRGLSFSGNFSEEGAGVYQTGHGAAHDLAGRNVANPIGQILSVEMVLWESFGWEEGATIVESAVESVVAAGHRTADIAAAGAKPVGTREFGELVCGAISGGVRNACHESLSTAV